VGTLKRRERVERRAPRSLLRLNSFADESFRLSWDDPDTNLKSSLFHARGSVLN